MPAPSFRAASTIVASSATSGSLSPALPTGHAANDILIINVWVYNTGGSAPTISTPTGYTLLRQQSTTTFLQKVFWKRDSGSESAPSISFTAGGTTTTECAIAVMAAFQNAVTGSTPYEGDNGVIDAATGTSRAGASVTTTGAARLGVHCFGFSDNCTVTINNAWTENDEQTTTTGSDACSYFATKSLSTGTEGAPTATTSTAVSYAAVSFALIGQAATIHVATTGNDTTGDGTSGNPYATISKASTVANSGDTVVVHDGSYTGGFSTSANGVIFKSLNKWGAKITCASSGAAANGESFWDCHGNDCTIQDFEIFGNDANTSGTWRIGIYCDGTTGGVTVQGCKIHDILRNATAFGVADAGNGGAAIVVDYFNGGANYTLNNNLIYNQGPDASTSSTTGHGLYFSSTGTAKNNVVYNCAGIGLQCWHAAHHVSFVNNTVDGARDCNILIGSGDSGVGPGTGDNCNVHNNISINSAFGILESGQTGTNNTYVNNIVRNNTTGIQLQNGLTASGTITSDPQFVDGTNRNYRLKSTSPAINAGSNTLSPSTDYLGKTRSGNNDIGAFEFITPSRVHHKASALTEQSTTNTTLTSAGTSVTFTPEANTNYLVIASGLMASSSTSESVSVELQDTTAAATLNSWRFQPKATADYLNFFGIAQFQAGGSPSSQSFDIKFASVAGVQVSIKEARLIVLKMSSNDVFAASDTETTHNTSLVVEDAATLTFTPLIAGDYVVIATCEVGNTGATGSSQTLFHLNIDGTNVYTGNRCSTFGNTADRKAIVGLNKHTFSVDTHTVKIQVGSNFTNAVARRYRIAALRLDDFVKVIYGEDYTPADTTTNQSFQDSLSVTDTPNAADYLGVFAGYLQNSNATDAGAARVLENGTARWDQLHIQSPASENIAFSGGALVNTYTAAATTWKNQYRETQFGTASFDGQTIVLLQVDSEPFAGTVSVPVGNLVLTGFAPTLLRQISIPAGALSLTGAAPAIVIGTNIAVPVGTLSLTGFAPTLHKVVLVPAGAINLNGFAPTLLRTVPVPAATLGLTGFAPNVIALAPNSVLVPTGQLTLTGLVPTLLHTLAVPAGALTLTGLAPFPDITPPPGNDAVVTVPPGALLLTGYPPTVGTTTLVIAGETIFWVFDSIGWLDYTSPGPQPLAAGSFRATGACQRCPRVVKRPERLHKQMAYAGKRLVWTGFLVCERCLDVPNPQDQVVVTPPDPPPVKDSRFDDGVPS